MVILQDTREQSPLKFEHEYITGIKVKKLEVGDYGCQFENGHIPPIFFERKSIGDLFSTMGKGHKRFKKELSRAVDNKLAIILLIEGTLTKVYKGTKWSTIEGSTIVKKMFTMLHKYGLYFWCCKNREEMSKYIIDFYLAIGRMKLKDFRRDAK